MTRLRTATLAIAAMMLQVGCGTHDGPPASTPTTTSTAPRHAEPGTDAKLAAVAGIHGGAGPWAVAGYRMGEYALGVLGLEHGSFDLEIVHFTPREVQYSCIADGAAAATGASLGKLNLALTDAPAADTHTTYRRKSTGKSITLRPAASFRARFANVPRDELADAGRVVVTLPDEQIFEVVAP